ncbi:MAG: LD-carboxypeptidase [Desulfobacterales bacterium]|jgi:muramoyltetrapeptide carboxypeptidase
MSIVSKPLTIPPRLKVGDTIGIVAPAGPFDRDKFDLGVQILRKKGFEVFIPERLFETKGYLAGPDLHRATLVNQLFADASINAIMCARGGYGSMRLLPLLDYNIIENNPKVFIGFSDVSAILSVLLSRCGLVSFHGPMVATLADIPEKTLQSLLNAISSDDNIEIKLSNGVTVKPGSVSGAICGGNLTTLCHLIGTPFEPSFNNKIVFLEDQGEATYRVDRMLAHMKLAGCFDGVTGLILGSFKACGSMNDICDIVADIFNDCQIPVLAGLDAGHGAHNLTIPLGIETALDADRHLLIYQQPATT